MISLLIGRLAAIALTVTGIPREVARFQARSALTGSGFTTSESESVVNHPIRRRILMFLMLVGNLGLATVVAGLIGTFVNVSSWGRGVSRAMLLLAGLVALLLVSRTPWFDRRLAGLFARVLRRFTDLDTRDYAQMLRLSGDYGVSELHVSEGDWIAGCTLAELELPDEGVLVLGIVRPDATYVGAPTGSTRAEPGDTLMVYGRTSLLAELDRRRAGADGDAAHRDAVQRHERDKGAWRRRVSAAGDVSRAVRARRRTPTRPAARDRRRT